MYLFYKGRSLKIMVVKADSHYNGASSGQWANGGPRRGEYMYKRKKVVQKVRDRPAWNRQ